MTKFYPNFSQILTKIWFNFEKILNDFWLNIKRISIKFWRHFRPIIMKFRPNFDRFSYVRRQVTVIFFLRWAFSGVFVRLRVNWLPLLFDFIGKSTSVVDVGPSVPAASTTFALIDFFSLLFFTAELQFYFTSLSFFIYLDFLAGIASSQRAAAFKSRFRCEILIWLQKCQW